MATTTHPAPNILDVTATDAMDLHSDSGLDFGDADIELDLDSMQPAAHNDDDVSINDVVTDVGLETQTVSADQDDYMVDNEDVIEEDDLDYGVEIHADLTLASGNTANEEQNDAQADEDLLDYSDEEEQQFMDDQGVPVTQDLVHGENIQHDDTAEYKDKSADGPGTAESSIHHKDETDNHQLEYENDGEEHAKFGSPLSHAGVPEAQSETDDHSDDNDGGVTLQAQDVREADEDQDSESEEGGKQFASRPITLNYEGNELWLLREHDTEDSGDWLLEDNSVIQSSVSIFLQACRTALGEDISPETELGLRFDHLHNMELYEDNTACVAVSLQRLIELYYTLHAQDGNSEPESFYMSLLSRPRFATLLSDVAKYAEQGSGYSGLSSAVAAGDTHFIDTFSGHSTEHENTEWENEGEEGRQEQTETPSDSEHDVGQDNSEETNVDNVGEDAAEQEIGEDDHENDEHDENAAYEAYTHASHSEDESHGSALPDNADIGEAVAQDKETSDSKVEVVSQSAEDARKEQEAQDTVDYSDDEGVEEQNVSVNAPSPSSRTIHGDDVSTGEHGAPIASTLEHINQNSPHAESTNDHDTPSASEQPADNAPADVQSNYDQLHDEEHTLQEFQVGDEDDQSYEPDFGGFTNEEYIDYDYQDLDQQLQDDFANGPDYNGDGATGLENALTGTEEYLDLDGPPEWTTGDASDMNIPNDTFLLHVNDDVAQEQEEEDGVVEHPMVAASPAADPVAPPSAELDNTSQQGLKRSIDKVGNTVDDAPDSIDIKRPRV